MKKKFRQVEIIVYTEHWEPITGEGYWNLCEEIDSLRCPALLSPLHDKDKVEKGKSKGKLKKPHYHLLLFFDSTKSLNQIKQLSMLFNNGADNLYKEIISVGGAVAYLSHKNSPTKAAYDEQLICSFGGANYHDLLNEKLNKFAMILRIIEQDNISTFTRLCKRLQNSDEEYLLDEVSKRSFAINCFLNNK